MPPIPLGEGATLAGYRIDGVIGAGRAGTVYRATQTAPDRPVALRVLAPDLTGDEGFRRRFRREVALQARLEHPHVLPVYEVGEADDETYMAMLLVDGSNLKQLVREGALTPERALDLLDPIAGALDVAHEAGLIHRGIKPQDILVDARGHPYLADFGLTKAAGEYGLTHADRDAAPLDYISPEQIRHRAPTASSDLYAFAVVLYEALSGDLPFARDNRAAMFYAHLSEPPPRLTERQAGLPPELDDVMARGLAKEPDDRYSSASELVAAAREALEPRSRVTVARRASPVALLALAALVPLLALAGFRLGHVSEASEQPITAAVGAGPLTLAFPPSWESLAGRAGIGGLRLDQPIVVTWGEKQSRGELWAGMARGAEGPLMLPSAFVRQLARPPTPETVRLGELAALRYRGLVHRDVKASLTLFVVPTDLGAATVACLQPRGGARPATGRTALERCEGIATTLALRGARPQALGPTPSYVAALRRALSKLDRARAAGRKALSAARTQQDQARAAGSLAREFGKTAAAVGRARPGLVERPGHRALARALRSAAGAYGALAGAARNDDRAGYRAGAAEVRRAEDSVERALRSFSGAGHRA
jgi:hypothetical protein